MTGMDLKIRRIKARVTTVDLAAAGGWRSRTRVSQIEAQAVVPEDVVRRYLDALESVK